MPFEQVTTMESPTGARLAMRHEPAEGDGYAILLIQHGLSEHSGRYGAFAHFMARRGFHVYAHDHRGHGRTQAADAPQGVFAPKGGATVVLEDCLAIRDAATASHPGLPVIVFGHSMGGLIALNLAQNAPAKTDAVAVWNANFDGGRNACIARSLLAAERMMLGSDVPSRLLPRFTFEAWGNAIVGHRTAFDWLSSRPEIVDAYMNDPLCGFLPSVSMWIDVFALIRRGGSAAALRRLPRAMPIHLVGGSADPSTGYGQALRRLAERARSAGLAAVTLRVRDGLRHETLNEPDADVAMAEFALWADRAVAGKRR